MQISIIIPIYKVEKYIERCINSVITQTFTDYEVILVDDASPDNALAVAEKLLQENGIEFQTVKHKENQGLAAARNNGLKVAKGKYVMFMDSDDDLADTDVLQRFYTNIERENADFVIANYNGIFGENDIRRGEYIKGISKNKPLENEAILEALLHTELSVAAWNKLINKDFLLQNNLFFPKGKTYEDELWFFQCCVVAQKSYCLSDYTYNYYKNIPNTMARSRGESDWNDMLWVIQQQLTVIKEKQLMNSQNADVFIFHFKRLFNEILRPKLLSNKKVWIHYYKQLRKNYQQSELYQYKKLFRLPANIAYFVRKEKHKNWKNKGNRYYGKFLGKINLYNCE